MSKRPDPRQFDLFAVALATAPVAIPADVQRDFDDEDAAERFVFAGSKADWAEDERSAWDQQWERNRRTFSRGAAAQAEGLVEILGWGAGAPGKQMSFSKPGYRLHVWNDHGRWRIKEDLDLHNSGSCGPYSLQHWPSRDEAVLSAFRRIIRNAAREEALASGWPDNATRAKQYKQLRNWCCEQMPPLMAGVDLAQEFADLLPVFAERERLRCAAICADKKSYIGEDGAERTIYTL